MLAHWKLTALNKQIIFHHLQNDCEDSESMVLSSKGSFYGTKQVDKANIKKHCKEI